MSKNTMKAVLQLRLSETELNRYNRLAILKGKNISQLIRDTMTQEISRSLSSDSDYDDVSTWKLESKPIIVHKVKSIAIGELDALDIALEMKLKAEKAEPNKKQIYEELYRLAMMLDATR